MNLRILQKRIAFILIIAFTFLIISFNSADQKIDSKYGGVQIGVISYSYRSMPDQSIPSYLNYVVETGLSSVELMGNIVENYAGIPQVKDAEILKNWRSTVSDQKFRDIRKMFDKKGIDISILKLGDYRWSDEEIDYAFKVCKILGARGISMEISKEAALRMTSFADKHKLYVIFHNHLQPGEPGFSFDSILAVGPRLMLNFDAGHYFGATGIHPNFIIERLHNRIASIHMKDKTAKEAVIPNTNRPWGQGDTPIADILKLVQKNNWPITCDIELEYTIPDGSDAVKEVTKCREYCKQILLPD